MTGLGAAVSRNCRCLRNICAVLVDTRLIALPAAERFLPPLPAI